MSNRSTNIKSRIFRSLNKNGVKNSDVVDTEIYDEIEKAQDHIISEVCTDKTVKIAMIDGVKEYDLTTEPYISGSTIQRRRNIASVKVVQKPSDWTDFEIVSNNEFVNFNNNLSASSSQPVIGTIIDSKLIVSPTPDSTVEGDEIELYVYLSSSMGQIDKDTEPEIPEYFDKALEYFATAQFLIGEAMFAYMKLFNEELMRTRPIYQRKRHNSSRKVIEGW